MASIAMAVLFLFIVSLPAALAAMQGRKQGKPRAISLTEAEAAKIYEGLERYEDL